MAPDQPALNAKARGSRSCSKNQFKAHSSSISFNTRAVAAWLPELQLIQCAASLSAWSPLSGVR